MAICIECLDGHGALKGLLCSAVTDDTVKGLSFYFLGYLIIPDNMIGELAADVQGFFLKVTRVMTLHMILLLSDRSFKGRFL